MYSKLLRQRIIHTVDNNPTIYEVTKYNTETHVIDARMVYDQNAILIEDDQGKYTMRVNLNEELDKIHIMDKEEEEGVLKEMENDSHTLVIRYIIEAEGSAVQFTPISVQPSFVNVNDYDIRFNSSQRCIGKVVNKSKDCDVLFKGEEVDLNEGIISFTPIDIWTTLNNVGDVRILHCHLVDMSEAVPIAINHLPPSSKLEYYFKFEKDMTGQDLKYKILIQNGKVAAIIYNLYNKKVESLPFNEIRVKSDEVMQSFIPEQYEQPIIVKLLPTSALYW